MKSETCITKTVTYKEFDDINYKISAERYRNSKGEAIIRLNINGHIITFSRQGLYELDARRVIEVLDAACNDNCKIEDKG